MAELIYRVLEGARCDARGCGQIIELPEPVSYFEGTKALEGLARPLGWSMWVGRTRRTYCRDHGPRPGSKLRKVW
ncbi:hypothetical protein [Amycolatopsis sp. NPDC051128]|uniref:hypothetical protein n=1 Tax=Amycolatopsis sp. NPDC051128 TaxID=3155412 RepID=UPI00343595F5